jgi:hypothetical protein
MDDFAPGPRKSCVSVYAMIKTARANGNGQVWNKKPKALAQFFARENGREQQFALRMATRRLNHLRAAQTSARTR